MNAMSPIGIPDGTPRSSHVVPRSLERNSRVPATSAHTMSPDGALIVAMFGSVIGVPVGVGAAVGDGLGVGVAVGAGLGVALGEGLGGTVGDAPAGPQAVRSSTSARPVSLFKTA
jgi:hypothetical protein